MKRFLRSRLALTLITLVLLVGVTVVTFMPGLRQLRPERAEAASSDRVLILAGTVTGGSSSIEASEVAADGLTVDVVDATTWSAMTAAQFASYRAIILGDPTCVGPGTSPDIDAAAANAKVWGPAINGNIVILGTDPVYHASQGGETVTRRGVDFAVNQVGKTGAYITLSCYYHGTAPNTPVPLLDGIGAGGFTVTGVGCYNNAHIVAESPALSGLTDTDISNWSCSVHEAFQTWASGLIPLAIAKDFDSSFTASDGTQGPPYILAGGDIRSFPLSITPLNASAATGGPHTVTAQLLDGVTRNPLAGAKIGFQVTAGPNAGVTGVCSPASCVTGTSGQVSWTYTSNGSTGSDTIEAFYDMNNNGTADVGEPQTTAGMQWTKAQYNYIALGDSYSSGEGNPPFLAPTDGPSDYCHRSPEAYSQVLGTAYGLQPKFYACSGAKTNDITTTKKDGEPPQITDPGVDNTAGLITMTIGGNNAGFGDVLTSCIELKLAVNLYNAKIGPVANWLGFGLDPSCADYKTFVDSVNGGIDNVFHPVKDTYKALLSKTGASIIVADYPHLFPDSSSEQSCLELAPLLTSADQQYFNTAGDRLDGVLQTAAGQAGVNFVDVRSIFAGHGVCGNGGSWINGLSIASGNGGSCTFSAFGKCIIPGIPTVGSFHPNASGQADGYAAAFESYIKSATSLTPQGFPANPTALPDPPTVTVTPTDVVQTLTVLPVTTGTADCEGTYQAGQQLSVNGDGFTPGGAVQLYVTSPGLGPTGEQQVGQLTADSTGHIAGIIRIPLTATGFTPTGSKAGTIFVDAIGSGPGGVHTDDVAMEGLAPHSSSCGTVEQLPFNGFYPPVANLPQVNTVQPGQSVPVKFALPGMSATINDVLASGYPQSGPVPCSNPSSITSGDPAVSANGNASSSLSDNYNYVWKTDPSWRGCRELIVKLVDGSYHQAVFDFGP